MYMETSAVIRQIVRPDEETVNTLTGWMFHWWGQQEGYPWEAVQQYIRNSCQAERLPRTYGLYAAGQLAGMYQIRLDDLFVRPDLYPWLANVYLPPEVRGRGYGRNLLESVADTVRQLHGFDALYLYTTHQGLYEKFGWELVELVPTFKADSPLERLYRMDL